MRQPPHQESPQSRPGSSSQSNSPTTKLNDHKQSSNCSPQFHCICINKSSPETQPDSTTYDADDEDPDETFFFPCHSTFDHCNPDLLSEYHLEYLELSRKSFYLIKYPKLFEYIIEAMFKDLKSKIFSKTSTHQCNRYSPSGKRKLSPLNRSVNLNPIIALVKKLNIVCLNEKRNCKTLAINTEILNILMRDILFLIQELPNKQSIYLDQLLKFALILTNYKVTGTNLKQLFNIIKYEKTDLKIVLENLDNILDRQHKIRDKKLNQKSASNSKSTTSVNCLGFGSALSEAGGIESFLIFFAEVIRRSQKNPSTHALAFSILLRMSQTNIYHLTKFLDELNGLKMMEFILAHPKCIVSKRMLECYLDFCLVKEDSYCMVKSPTLLYHLMNCWRAWHKDVKVAKLFYRRLTSLLEPRNLQLTQTRLPNDNRIDAYYINHNLEMMNNAGGIDILMEILRECLVPLDDISHSLTHELIELIVNLISMLIKDPPGLDFMLDIMEFLLFLHPDPKAYVETTFDKTLYFYKIDDKGQLAYEDQSPGHSNSVSPSSSSDSLSSGYNDVNTRRDVASGDSYNDVIRDNSRGQFISRTSSDDLFKSTEKRISDKCSENLAELYREYNITNSDQQAQHMNIENEQTNKTHFDMNNPNPIKDFKHPHEHKYSSRTNQSNMADNRNDTSNRCSNRDYAIAVISDLLASIIKKNSIESMKVLSEALLKSIIDPRKIIILANNNSSLVRERVLRLFLYSIRSCYSLNLKPILNKYDYESKTTNFKVCLPMQLMARQLLKYPTTSKMIQLCYAIIVDVDDSDLSGAICLTFDIDINNNHLQSNALLLLIQLMTQLKSPLEIASALEFVSVYLERLTKLGETSTVLRLMKNTLVDSMMKLYFSYVEHQVSQNQQGSNSEDFNTNDNEQKSNDVDFELVVQGLDRMLSLIIRYYMQNQPTEDAIESMDQLLKYFDLLNTCVPNSHHFILRNRQVKVLTRLLKYSKHYERCAKRKIYGSKVDYYFQSLFKKTYTNRFNNILTQSESTSASNDDSDVTQHHDPNQSNLSSDGDDENSSRSPDTSDDDLENMGDENVATSATNGTHKNRAIHPSTGENDITESDVIHRIKATMNFAVTFITTRSAGTIPSPPEREFIMHFIELLAQYLDNQETTKARFSITGRRQSHWSMMLTELRSSMSSSFSCLVLYLLSSCESMDIDERKYCAHRLLKLFTVDELLNLLDDDSKQSTYKVLLVFTQDLFDRSNSITSSFDGILDNDDELSDDIESKLMELVKKIRFELGIQSDRNVLTMNGGPRNHYLNREDIDMKFSNLGLTKTDILHSEIWLTDLKQSRLDAVDQLNWFKEKIQKTSVSSLMMLDDANTDDQATNKLLDEAVSITKDVVNDKHEQRKSYLEDVKQFKVYQYHVRQQWLSLIIIHTHERAIWNMPKYYPKSWELNPVEGPSRTRRRLRPCKLTLESRFLRKGELRRKLMNTPVDSRDAFQSDEIDPFCPYVCPSTGNLNDIDRSGETKVSDTSDSEFNTHSDTEEDEDEDLFSDDWYNQYSPHPLCSLIINHEQSMDSNELKIRMFTTDKIHFNCDCSIIRPNEVCDGEVSIASWCIHFIGEKSDSYQRHLNYSPPLRRAYVNQKRSRHNSTRSNDGYQSVSRQDKTKESSNREEQEASSTKDAVNLRRAFVSTIVEDLWFDEIVEIWDRRYQLQEVGLEIFLTNNMTYLLSFRNNRDREDFKQHLMREQHKMINLQRFNLTTSLSRLTQLWRDGRLTNFDYLTRLNKLAGRSFNDLMQYPIFPFVLSNYTSDRLDLNSPKNFRKLERPMAIQNENREENFIENYRISESSNLSVGPCGLTKPYHYSNHYSNSATVLHFLVRLPPFTQMLIQYQDNNFDQPDRTFHSIANTWQLITRDSNTDFKELIPEFFFLPEMFINIESLELGLKQNNELVDDVRLPPWCPNSDARLFTLIHRQALESAYVSENLHNWIDLIFGFKQTGKAAVDAINVFHPATYYGGIDISSNQTNTSASVQSSTTSNYPISSALATISAKSSSNHSSEYCNSTNELSTYLSLHMPNSDADSSKRDLLKQRRQAQLERSALETMIKTYGQMPRQLFYQPMRQRSLSTFVQQLNENRLEQQQQQQDVVDVARMMSRIEPLKRVKGLRWGTFVGSPGDSDIIAVKHKHMAIEDFESYKSEREFLSSNSLNSEKTSSASSQEKYHLCLLSNGDIVVLRHKTSLMLDYRADRKSEGTYQLAIPSARYSRRAGLRSVARMNLFSNMIISRQQFSFLEPICSSLNQLDPLSSAAPSTLVSFSTGTRVKFSPESLSLVNWVYPDGIVRVKHPVTSNQKASTPLVQANTGVDTMSTCCSIPELNLLLVGYESGSICAHIITTSYETVSSASQLGSSLSLAATALSSNSAAPSAVHFIHTTSNQSDISSSRLGPGKLMGHSMGGQPLGPVSLAGKTLQSVRSMNRASRWLYCHSRRVNCIRINVSFGIVVTGSDDGTSVIWDLNSLTYVRSIDYKYDSLRIKKQTTNCNQQQTRINLNECSWTFGHADRQRVLDYLCNCSGDGSGNYMRTPSRISGNGDVDEINQTSRDIQQCWICRSCVSLIAISDTLGDIVTIKDINNRLAAATDDGDPAETNPSATSQELDDETSITSILYVHTINGSLVGFVNCHTKVTAVCYSNAPEGISVNVIVVGLADGLVRLYSSWDLSRVKEFRVSGLSSPISSLLYSRDSQLLYVAYVDGQLVVLRNKKKGSIAMPKEWYL